VPHRGERV